jgi:hypothetical protein
MFLISGSIDFVLQQQLHHHHLIIVVHCRWLCKLSNTFQERKAKLVAAADGCRVGGRRTGARKWWSVAMAILEGWEAR